MSCVQVEAKFAEQLCALEARVEQLETQQDQTGRHQSDQLKCFKTKLGKRMSSVENSLHRELQLLKHEYHKGG